MRARVLAWAGVLSIGACVYPAYRVAEDGGSAGTGGSGTTGTGGRGGGTAGTLATAGRGGATAGSGAGGGAGTGAAGTAGRGGTTGAAGSAAGTGGGAAGTGGGTAGRGGTTGAAGSAAGTGGGVAGRGGTTGTAGTGGGAAGRGGTTGLAGTGGGTAGRGGTTGTGGTAAGGSTGAGGSTAAPDWVPSFSVVYQFDLGQGQLGVEAHGNPTALHLEEQGTFFPISDPAMVAIEGNSAQFRLMAQDPGRLMQPGGTTLPSVLQTAQGTSFTLGGWFRIGSSQSGTLQYLISDDGPGDYMGGFIFNLDQTSGAFGSSMAAAYCRIGTSGSATDFNYNEARTPNDIGADTIAGNRWAHLVCRYDANAHTLSIFVGGVREVQNAAPMQIRSGPGPFMLGCDQTYCGFAGNMDEVFFTRSALDDAHIYRIHACGIDGSRCRCSGVDYVSCGFAGPSGCTNTNLPNCDVAQ